MKFKSTRRNRRGRLQSAFPKKRPTDRITDVRGLKLKGVVIETFVYDTDSDRYPGLSYTINAVYCNVFVYGRYSAYLENCIVKQDRGDMHQGAPWIPRPTSQEIGADGRALAALSGVNVESLDGEHVVVEFLENDPQRPIVTGGLPHPRLDNKVLDAAKEFGARLRSVGDDGQPRILRHRGVYVGVDTNGNVILDATEANDGTYDAQGEETPNPGASHGNVTVRLGEGTTLTLQLGNDRTMEIRESDAGLDITLPGGTVNINSENVRLGEGATEAVIKGDAFATWLTTQLSVQTAFGPSGPALTPPTSPNQLSANVKTK